METACVALLRLVRGNDFWKSVHAPSKWCFGRRVFDHGSFYLRLVGLECTYCVCVSSIGELDCVGFCPFELWRCVFFEMMWGIGGEGLFFIFRISPGIARVSPKTRYLSCFAAAAAVAVVVVKLCVP